MSIGSGDDVGSSVGGTDGASVFEGLCETVGSIVDHVGAGLLGCVGFGVRGDEGGVVEALACVVGAGSHEDAACHKDTGMSDGFAIGTMCSGFVLVLGLPEAAGVWTSCGS